MLGRLIEGSQQVVVWRSSAIDHGLGLEDLGAVINGRSRGVESPPRRYPSMPYILWQADGVIFGHFLSATREDVAMNCFGCDGHAAGWQILFCEETDGGMGHRIHGLYTVDFTNPKFAWRGVVLMAGSYSSHMMGGAQTQSIERVLFDQAADGGVLIRIFVRHGKLDLPPDYPNQQLPKPLPASTSTAISDRALPPARRIHASSDRLKPIAPAGLAHLNIFRVMGGKCHTVASCRST